MNQDSIKAIAAADQENARLAEERSKSPDGMTASERAMATSASDRQNARALLTAVQRAEERSKAMASEGKLHPDVTGNLRWIDDRWHADGKPIHAGSVWELATPGGWWIIVRIESEDSGHRLIAYIDEHGMPFRRYIDVRHDRLRPRTQSSAAANDVERGLRKLRL